MLPAILPIALIISLLVILFNLAGSFLKQASEATQVQYKLQFQLLKMRFSMVLIIALMFIAAVLYAGFKLDLKAPKLKNQAVAMNMIPSKSKTVANEEKQLPEQNVLRTESGLFTIIDGTKYKMIDVKKYRLNNLTDRPRKWHNGREYYLIPKGKIS